MNDTYHTACSSPTSVYLVQVGYNKGSYQTRWSFIGDPVDALGYYNAISVRRGYKKRLVVDGQVIDKVVSKRGW